MRIEDIASRLGTDKDDAARFLKTQGVTPAQVNDGNIHDLVTEFGSRALATASAQVATTPAAPAPKAPESSAPTRSKTKTPAEAVQEAQASVDDSVTSGFDQIRAASEQKFNARIGPFVERISDAISERNALSFFSTCQQLAAHAANQADLTSGTSLGNYQIQPGMDWLTVEASATPILTGSK